MKLATLAFALVTFALTRVALTRLYGGGRIRMSPRLAGRSPTAAQLEYLEELYERRLRAELQPQLQQQLEEQQQQQQQQGPSGAGASLCSCSPRSFSITLDLSNNCNDDTVKKNSGIAFTICSIEVFDSIGNIIPNGDPTPTVITSVTLIEINSVGTVINVDDQYTNVDFRTGSSFGLRSVSSSLSPGRPIGGQASNVPTTAVLFMIGKNAHDGEEIIATFVWIYSNSCDGVTLDDGDEYAWNVWTGVEEQNAAFCPANASGAPSGSPTASSRPTASGRPSAAPSAAPSGEPSAGPSPAPSGVPSGGPSGAPSGGPSGVPTLRPAGEPSRAPSAEPTRRSSDRPSGRPSAEASDRPSGRPSVIFSRENRSGASGVATLHGYCFIALLCLTARLVVH